MIIRLEQPKDYREVENLTREAFWNVYRPGCTEHYVLNQYRTNPDFIPELGLVMERLRDGCCPCHRQCVYGPLRSLERLRESDLLVQLQDCWP